MPKWWKRMAVPDRVIAVIMALNVLVFVGWNTGGRGQYVWMSENFLVSPQHLLDGRVWTLLTSEVSHSDASHLLFNMLALYVFGRPVGRVVGGRGLVHLYVVGALLASLGFVAFDYLTGSSVPALGASGAVMTLGVVFAALFPRVTLLIFGIVPMPAALAVALYVAFDLYGLTASGSGIAHAAHLGGAAYGLLYWWRYLRGGARVEMERLRKRVR